MVRKIENRKYRRYDIEGVRGYVLNAADLDVINISAGGAAIETPRRLEINREYSFKIKSENRFLRVKGRVVWAILISREKGATNEAVPVYRAGIKFTEMVTDKAKTLRDFIEENKIRALEHRLAGVRFKISNTGNITLDYPYECRVRQISLTGMLIETECPLVPDATHDIELFVGGRKLKISGRVSNCEESAGAKGPTYDVGVEFASIADADKLLDFLRKLN